MLIAYLAVDLNGSPALEVTEYPVEEWDRCEAYIRERAEIVRVRIMAGNRHYEFLTAEGELPVAVVVRS